MQKKEECKKERLKYLNVNQKFYNGDNKMIILGIDLSLHSTGFFICSDNYKVIHCGTLKGKTVLEQYEIISDLIVKYKVDEVAIEEEFFSRNAKTLKQLSRLHGAILLLLEQKKIKYAYYSVMTAKSTALKGISRTNADGTKKIPKQMKQEVESKMFEVFGVFPNTKGKDVSDAASIAYTHLKQLGY